MSPCGRVSKKDSGQALHLVEESLAHVAHHPLGHAGHDPAFDGLQERAARCRRPAVPRPRRPGHAAGMAAAPRTEATVVTWPLPMAAIASMPLPIRNGTAMPSAESTRMKPGHEQDAAALALEVGPDPANGVPQVVGPHVRCTARQRARAPSPGPPSPVPRPVRGPACRGRSRPLSGQTPAASLPSWAMQMSR